MESHQTQTTMRSKIENVNIEIKKINIAREEFLDSRRFDSFFVQNREREE
jgi:hypothetical protein